MIEQCVVKKVKRGLAFVEVKRSDKCEGCKLCAFNKQNVMVVPALCSEQVAAGDVVTVQMPTKPVGAVALLIYALPLLGIVIGALIGLVGSWQLQLGLAAAGLVVGLAAIVPLERLYRKKSGVMPVVLPKSNEQQQQNINDGV
ncbi:MAG: SoxR reducing system RseC family protein [Clostridiales bacterium]|nr:SoxR reducing system RseC family protein [Clostridiales bacterium]